jgi:hypothetical protein
MTQNIKHLFVTLFAFVTFQSEAQIITISPFHIDSNQYRIDSVLNTVSINGELFSMIILRDKYTEQMLPFNKNSIGLKEYLPEQASITLLIANKADGKIRFKKRFETEVTDYPFQNWQFTKGKEKKLNQNGKLFFSLDKSYGGSGSLSTTYLIDISDIGIQATKIFTVVGELSDFMISKNNQKLISISGIWNTKEKEQHFSPHRYQIQTYNMIDGKVKKYNLGITSFKYPPIEDDNSCETIIQKIIFQEKTFAKKLLVD